jgi:hypothetical protein
MKLVVKLFGKNVFIDGSSYAKKIDYANYYPMSVLCDNCHNRMKIYIKKGVHLNDIITGVICNNCVCRLEKEK